MDCRRYRGGGGGEDGDLFSLKGDLLVKRSPTGPYTHGLDHLKRVPRQLCTLRLFHHQSFGIACRYGGYGQGRTASPPGTGPGTRPVARTFAKYGDGGENRARRAPARRRASRASLGSCAASLAPLGRWLSLKGIGPSLPDSTEPARSCRARRVGSSYPRLLTPLPLPPLGLGPR